jgi:maltose O-acetyltransferase
MKNKLLQFAHHLFDHLPILDQIAIFLSQRAVRRRILTYRQSCDIHPAAVLGDVILDRNVSIGEGSYMNSGQIFAGANSKVKIGRYCAIGYGVHIKARSHDPSKPTRLGMDDKHLTKEADIVIGDNVWIGDNVFIGPGIELGEHCIVGANSVVTHSIPAYAVVGGVPARLIRMQQPPV